MEANTTSAGAKRPKGYTHRLGFAPRPFSDFAKRQAMYMLQAHRALATMMAATVCQNAKLLMGASLHRYKG